MAVITRVGLPIPGGSLLRHVAKARLPALVSANAFYVRDKDGPGRFRLPKPGTFDGLDVALDSGGYVAMKQYGYYSWSPEEYLDLAAFPLCLQRVLPRQISCSNGGLELHRHNVEPPGGSRTEGPGHLHVVQWLSDPLHGSCGCRFADAAAGQAASTLRD